MAGAVVEGGRFTIIDQIVIVDDDVIGIMASLLQFQFTGLL